VIKVDFHAIVLRTRFSVNLKQPRLHVAINAATWKGLGLDVRWVFLAIKVNESHNGFSAVHCTNVLTPK